MKLAMALLLVAVPLVAEVPPNQKIVYNVAVTVVTAGSAILKPVPPPVPPAPPTPPPPTPPPTPPPDPPPPPPPPPPTGSCVSYYTGAAGSMNTVSSTLLQAQQLLATAFSAGTINAAVYHAGSQTLAQVRLDTSDVRDMVRIASPTGMVTPNITFVAAEIGTLPGVLGKTPQLKSSITGMAASMQANLGQASSQIASSTCAQAVP